MAALYSDHYRQVAAVDSVAAVDRCLLCTVTVIQSSTAGEYKPQSTNHDTPGRRTEWSEVYTVLPFVCTLGIGKQRQKGER